MVICRYVLAYISLVLHTSVDAELCELVFDECPSRRGRQCTSNTPTKGKNTKAKLSLIVADAITCVAQHKWLGIRRLSRSCRMGNRSCCLPNRMKLSSCLINGYDMRTCALHGQGYANLAAAHVATPSLDDAALFIVSFSCLVGKGFLI